MTRTGLVMVWADGLNEGCLLANAPQLMIKPLWLEKALLSDRLLLAPGQQLSLPDGAAED